MVEATRMRIDIAAPITPSATMREEPQNIRVLPYIDDTHGICVVDTSFRCMLQDTTFTINGVSVVVPAGDLDVSTKGMTVAIRFRRRMQDGSYRFVRSFDVTHSDQQRQKSTRDAATGRSYREFLAGPPIFKFCHLKQVTARTSEDQEIQIIDPRDEMYIVLNSLCRASEWPSRPNEATVNVEQDSAAEDYSLDDLPV